MFLFVFVEVFYFYFILFLNKSWSILWLLALGCCELHHYVYFILVTESELATHVVNNGAATCRLSLKPKTSSLSLYFTCVTFAKEGIYSTLHGSLSSDNCADAV